MGRDTGIFAFRGPGQQRPTFWAEASLSPSATPPDPQGIWLSITPWASSRAWGREWGLGGLGAREGGLWATCGAVSQNHIFMLTTTV